MFCGKPKKTGLATLSSASCLQDKTGSQKPRMTWNLNPNLLKHLSPIRGYGDEPCFTSASYYPLHPLQPLEQAMPTGDT